MLYQDRITPEGEREVTQQFTKEKFTAELNVLYFLLIFSSVHPFRTF